MKYLFLAFLPALALAEPPPAHHVRGVIIEISGVKSTLLCWRITLAHRPDPGDGSWPSVCVPASHGRVCVETEHTIDCSGGLTAPQRPRKIQVGRDGGKIF